MRTVLHAFKILSATHVKVISSQILHGIMKKQDFLAPIGTDRIASVTLIWQKKLSAHLYHRNSYVLQNVTKIRRMWTNSKSTTESFTVFSKIVVDRLPLENSGFDTDAGGRVL